jgi:transcriptional regulator with XRE-family HTH domain
MAEFNREQLDNFLGIVRKYMQVRGNLSQKDLAELVETGVSTISRFINQKTKDLDPQLIAKIVAQLDIPLHEMIDFVEENFSDRFLKLVRFYKDETTTMPQPTQEELASTDAGGGGKTSDEFADALDSTLGTAKKDVKGTINIGGKRRTLHFSPDQNTNTSELTIREKLEMLTPRQKAYMSDFLNLDLESKDLIVDLANPIFRYLRQKGLEF